MTTNQHVPEVRIPDAIPVELAATIAADIVSTAVLHGNNPRLNLASHVASVLLMAAQAITSGSPDDIDWLTPVEAADHLCRHHLEAALWVLGTAYLREGVSTEDIVRSVPGVMRDVLAG